jgi:hypothetical protein
MAYTSLDNQLQILQIKELLMQNSIINGLFVVVAWHYEKIKVMKTTNTHHEILFFTSTTLASRQLADTKENNNGKMCPAIEELEKACWNGIIHEIFPEILSSFYPRCQSFLWHVLAGKNFLYINIGPNPVTAEHDTSIDPYFFMMTVSEN